MGCGYIKLSRDIQTLDLMHYPDAFLLLTQIALRARRAEDEESSAGLEVGQALIGDWKSIGIKSEKLYRNAKKRLQELGCVNFKGTSRGTVATISNTVIYDINIKGVNERADKGRTSGQTKGGQRADKGASGESVSNGLLSMFYDGNKQAEGEHLNTQSEKNGQTDCQEWATNKNKEIKNKEINKNNLFIDVAPEFISRWYAFQKIYSERFPTVGGMKNQITPKELYSLSEIYSASEITDMLERMENYKNITKYTSVYLTLKNWLKKQAA